MREQLEEMRDRLVNNLATVSKPAALTMHDGITEMIDKAEELAPAVTVASVSMVRDMLNECLSNALTPLPKVKKHGDSKRNSKKRTVGRKQARKLKRSAR